MANIRLRINGKCKDDIQRHYEEGLHSARESVYKLRMGACPGGDMLGWLDLPHEMDGERLEAILRKTRELQEQYDTAVVVGIGGSFLGARAMLDALADQRAWGGMDVRFVGYTLCSDYLASQLRELDGRRVCVVVISKSGATMETVLAFWLLREYLQSSGRYDPKAVVVVTDEEQGMLHALAEAEGCEQFAFPRSVGGRFSVLSVVGLLPMALGGLDVQALLEGARLAHQECYLKPKGVGPAVHYACIRTSLYQRSALIIPSPMVEVLACYTPFLNSFGEWFKQLFAESEGKRLLESAGGLPNQRRGIFPVSASFTTDLHSLGQYLQEGDLRYFETHVRFQDSIRGVTIPDSGFAGDGLRYLAGRTLHEVNRVASEATVAAHPCPSITLDLRCRDAYNLGYLLFFMEVSCAISGMLLGVNPFDQPGVERYKQHMVELLGWPGYEKE